MDSLHDSAELLVDLSAGRKRKKNTSWATLSFKLKGAYNTGSALGYLTKHDTMLLCTKLGMTPQANQLEKIQDTDVQETTQVSKKLKELQHIQETINVLKSRRTDLLNTLQTLAANDTL